MRNKKVEKRENEKDIEREKNIKSDNKEEVVEESGRIESEKRECSRKRKEEVEEKEDKYIPLEPYKPQLHFPQRFQKAKLDK